MPRQKSMEVSYDYGLHVLGIRTAEARQRYQEYLDRFPWGEHAQEAQAALERLGEV